MATFAVYAFVERTHCSGPAVSGTTTSAIRARLDPGTLTSAPICAPRARAALTPSMMSAVSPLCESAMTSERGVMKCSWYLNSEPRMKLICRCAMRENRYVPESAA